MTRHSRRYLAIAWALAAVGVSACGPKRCESCRTVVVAAVGEPTSVFPPLVFETVGRDIGDLVFERLADLKPERPTIDPDAYAPRLASHWEQADSLTLRFHLRKDARWQDGAPVTAEDVRFSFDVFADSVIDALARPQLQANIRSVDAEDSATVLVRFTHAYPEQLYDATYHVRVIPRHIWDSIPRSRWPEDTSVAMLVGSGPFRIEGWTRGQSLSLRAVDPRLPAGRIDRVVWRFTAMIPRRPST